MTRFDTLFSIYMFLLLSIKLITFYNLNMFYKLIDASSIHLPYREYTSRLEVYNGTMVFNFC